MCFWNTALDNGRLVSLHLHGDSIGISKKLLVMSHPYLVVLVSTQHVGEELSEKLV